MVKAQKPLQQGEISVNFFFKAASFIIMIGKTTGASML